MGGLMFALFHRDGYIPMFLISLSAFIVLGLCIPHIILCANYYKNDRKKQLSIDFDKRFVIISKSKNKKKFYFEDISNITKVGANLPQNEGFTTIAPWRYFYFYKIELQDKRIVCITRFLIQKLEKVVPDLPYEYRFQIFPLIKDYYEEE